MHSLKCSVLCLLRARSKPSLRLCRPPLVVARGEERAQPPAEYRSHSLLQLPGGPAAALQLHSIQGQLASPRSGWPAQHTHAPPTPSQGLLSPLPVPRKLPSDTLEHLTLPLTDAVIPRKGPGSQEIMYVIFLVSYLVGKIKRLT